MAAFDTSRQRPLGTGFQTPGDAITDPELAARFKGYKKSIASRYRAITGEEI